MKKLLVIALYLSPLLAFANGESAWLCEWTILGRRQFLSKDFTIRDGKVRVAFLDADDTLRRTLSGTVAPNFIEDVQIIAGVADKLRSLNEAGYLLAVVSNQNGVSAHTSIQTADRALLKMIDLLRRAGAIVHYYDFCEFPNHNRKPKAGMAQTLAYALKTEFGPDASIDLANSFMVGNAGYKIGEIRPDGSPGTEFSNSDRRFAEAVGVNFFEAREFFLTPIAEPPLKLPKKAGRNFVPLTEADLREKIIAAAMQAAVADHDTFNPDRLYDSHRLLELGPKVKSDLSKVSFGIEYVSAATAFGGTPKSLLGFHTVENGLTYFGVNAGGGDGYPIFFIIYWDGTALRGYIPSNGNTWNTDTHAAYGLDEKTDLRNAKKRFPAVFSELDDGDFNVDLLSVDAKLINEDLNERFSPRD